VAVATPAIGDPVHESPASVSASQASATVRYEERVVAAIERSAHPLKSTDPEGSSRDLHALGRMVRDAEVVGLGEATHGSRDFFRMKHLGLPLSGRGRGFPVLLLGAPLEQLGAAFGTEDNVMRTYRVGAAKGDAQTRAFSPEHFTLAVSRFGTMFFSDPVAAFANIGRALRPGARFVQLVWQAADRQEWHTVIRAALSHGLAPSASDSAAADPFTLADPDVVAEVLTRAGFTEADVVDVREPVCYGPDTEGALAAVLELRMAKEWLSDPDAASAERAFDRLRVTLDAHDSGDGVWFDSRAWLVVARRS
jgi:SAM-dependent methyltransferase